MWRTSSDNGHFGSSEVCPLLPSACPHLIYSFTEKGTERRNIFLLPNDSAGSPSEASSSGHTGSEVSSQTPPTEDSLSKNPSTEATASNIPPTKTTPSQDPSAGTTSKKSRSKPRKIVPQGQPPTSVDPIRHPQPKPTSTPQAAVTSDTSKRTPTHTSDLPIPDAPIDPPADVPDLDEDAASLSATANTRELPSQVATVSQVGSLNTVEPSQLVINPSRLVVGPPQVVVAPSQAVVGPSQPVVELIKPSQTTTESAQHISESSKVSTEVVPMDTRPDSPIAPTPSQPFTEVANPSSDVPAPGVPYKVRNTTTAHSGGRSRRGSIDGAPEMVVDPIDEEITVDLRDYINLDSDEETHVSSSQKTADECRELSPPSPDSQQKHTSLRSSEDHTTPTRTLPQLDVDQEDFPSWMTKKGQWKYVTSTAGGTAWENLLKIYINQERRLAFTETVSDLGHTFPTWS